MTRELKGGAVEGVLELPPRCGGGLRGAERDIPALARSQRAEEEGDDEWAPGRAWA